MHLLLTNDDGIDAPGLNALASALETLPSVRISIVAPLVEQSLCSHRVTTHSPLFVEARGTRSWAVDGTPADCVRIALFALDLKPDWVISGINAGGNLGQDIAISGTVSAAREAAFHGLPAMAFSHYLIRNRDIHWPHVSAWARTLLTQLSGEPLHDGEFWNINFPHLDPAPADLPEFVRCHPARAPLNVSYEAINGGSQYRYNAVYAERPQEKGSDVEVCFNGRIAVSRLRL